MEGMAYRFMDANDKKQVHVWRKEHGRCGFCGGPLHTTFQCEAREVRFQNGLEKKRQKQVRGELVTEFTGPMARLPLELRAEIWRKLMKVSHPIKIEPGLMSKYMVRYSLPFAETFAAWLSVNTFELNTRADIERFDRILTTFGGHCSVRAISTTLPNLKNFDQPFTFDRPPRPLYDDLHDGEFDALLKKCTGLSKIMVVVQDGSITAWNNDLGPEETTSTTDKINAFMGFVQNMQVFPLFLDHVALTMA